LLDEIMNDIQYEHGLDSPVYAKLKEFFDEWPLTENSTTRKILTLS
jgi:hypothetical protein